LHRFRSNLKINTYTQNEIDFAKKLLKLDDKKQANDFHKKCFFSVLTSLVTICLIKRIYNPAATLIESDSSLKELQIQIYKYNFINEIVHRLIYFRLL